MGEKRLLKIHRREAPRTASAFCLRKKGSETRA